MTIYVPSNPRTSAPRAQSRAVTVTLSFGSLPTRPLPPAISPHLGTHSSWEQPGMLPEPLTSREQDVLALLAVARTNREIAEHLHISLRTVECHLGSIYGKLGVRGRLEAMLWAVHADIRLAHSRPSIAARAA